METPAQHIAQFARTATRLDEPERARQAVALVASLDGVMGAACVTAEGVVEHTVGAAPHVEEAWSEEARAVRVPRLFTRQTTTTAVCAVPGTARVLAACGPTPLPVDTLLHLLSLANVLGDVALLASVGEALQFSEARAQAILDTTVDAIITIDETRTILSFNSAAEQIFGYAASEVIGQNVNLLMPEPYRSEHDAYVERYLLTGQRRIIGIGREVTGLRKDGSVFPMDLAVSEVEMPHRRIFTGIVRDISERRTLEQEVLRISDLERRRIGQDLHDGLGQMLTGIGLIAGGLARRARTEAPQMAEDVEEVVSLMREADAFARGLARGLVPVDIEQGGLVGALERMVNTVPRLFDVQCRLHVQGNYQIEDQTVAMHLYRIAQEAVSNAARHSHAERINVLLVLGDEQVRLRVRDDGAGLPPSLADDPHEGPRAGMGLRIMHYRARIIGASLDVSSSPGGGTTVLCTRRHDGHTPARSIEEQLRDLNTESS